MLFDAAQFEEHVNKMPMNVYLAELRKMSELAKKKPKDAQLHTALAFMYIRTHSWADAVRHLKKANKLAPRAEIVLKTLCDIYYASLKNYKEAAAYLKKWAFIRKDEAKIWIHLANSLLHTDKHKDAMEALDRAEALEPDSEEISLVRADVYTKMGDESGAKQEYEKAFALSPGVKAAAGLISLPNYDPGIERLEELYDTFQNSSEKVGRNNLTYSHFGSAFEKLKAYDRAFECFALSNRAGAKRLDRDQYMSSFKNIRETFTKEFMLARAAAGDDSDQPVFIVGMPRSGTTLTESILAAHPKIIDNGELPFFTQYLKRNGLEANTNELLRDNLPGLKDNISKIPVSFFARIADGYKTKSGFKKNDKRYQVDKLPHNFLSVGLIHLVFPNAKIIHCRRHPMDGALSCYKAAFSEFHDYAADLSFLGSYYRNYWDLMEYWRKLLPGRMFEICYEDTVANTELVARKMIEHIGLEWDDRCLDHTRSKKAVRTASQWQVRQPVYTSSVAKWKNYEEQLAPMRKAMGSIVEEYEQLLVDMA